MRWHHWLHTIPLRLRSVFRRNLVEHELDEEISFHLERQIAEHISRGATPQHARESALRALRGIEQRKEECRDARRVNAVDEIRRNLRFAWRRIRRTPGLSAAAIFTLALGIGATTTVFAALDTLVLRPLPVQASSRLVFLNRGDPVTFSYPDYSDFRDHNDVLTGLMAYRAVPMNLGAEVTGNVRIWGYEATGNYFELLGVRPFLGRLLRPDDDVRRGGHPVVVLNYDCWQRRFLGDPAIINRTVKINGLTYTVLGVAQAGFRGTELILNPDVWVPMSMAEQIEPGEHWLDSRSTTNVWMVGRLEPGVSPAQAEASLNRIAKRLAQEYPDTAEGMTVELSPPGLVGKALRGPITQFAGVLMGVAALVLLLACFNLAGMLVASAADRRKEIALRLALGATKAQIVRQLLTESLLLAMAGAAAGLFGSALLARWFGARQLPFDLPVNTTVVVDVRVVFFAMGIALLATLAFGLIPALQTARPDLVPALKDAAVVEPVRGWHLRDILVGAQIALSVMLLIASLLVVRSLQRALDLDTGFNPKQAVSASFDLGLDGYTEERGRAFQQQAEARVARVPGIGAVGLVSNMPLRVGGTVDNVSIAGRPPLPPDRRVAAVVYSVSEGYFAAAGTRLLSGRAMSATDREHSPHVAVVNETFVRRLLGRDSPLGQRFLFGAAATGDAIEIVGVAQDGKYQSLGEEPTPAVFLPLTQRYSGWTTLVARTSLPPGSATQAVRVALLELDPSLTLFNVGSLEDQLALPLFPVRVAASVLGMFGLMALVLSSTGVFALVAHCVSRRAHEIGIRVALGAGVRDVLALVLGRTVALLAIGSFLGSVIALAGGRAMSAILYDVSPRDPAAYLVALLLMAAIAILASLYPARRAMRVNPAKTVRQE